MRVYKFLNCKYGLKAIRERRLKISEVGTLNDPFELLPFDLSDPEIRKGIIDSRREIGRKSGLLCFSRSWHNPVLWSHYAENNKGMCLGFDVPDDQKAVEYIEHPIKLTHLNYEVADQMIFTKYEHWRYEEEIRIWATLNERSGNYYFYDYGDTVRLVEVIVGAGSSVSERKILQALGQYRSGVRILKARLAYDAFRVVEDENGFVGWSS